ncbi:MAG: divergent polysaccharide deacetylase family protein [Terriglobia bacterium]
MVKRRKSKRKRTQSRSHLWILLVALIALTIFFVARSRSRSPHREDTTHRGKGRHEARQPQPSLSPAELAQRFQLALKQAAGDNIWIKEEPSSASGAFNVLITPAAYNAAEQAILRTAHEQRVHIAEFDVPEQPAAMHSDKFTAYSGDKPLCGWTVREVPRIVRVAIIVDDLGQNLNAARKLIRLRSPLTFSIMPSLRYSRTTAEDAHREGVEVMLHLPMQPLVDSAPDVSPQELKVGMGSPEVDRIIQNSLESVPYASGVNNHMGSRATADPRLMGKVMAELAGRHLYYIDSRTIPNSVALRAARRSGVPAFYRSVFLDDTKSVPYTLGQLRELCRVARRHGVALAIGHPYATTIAALSQFLPELAREDIQLVRVSRLLRQPEAARLSPSSPRWKQRGQT